MRKILSNRKATALLLITLGAIGILLGPLLVWWATILAGLIMIGYAIYCFYKKSFDPGIISLLIGISLIIISRLGIPLRIIQFISIGCLVVGIVLFIVYLVTER